MSFDKEKLIANLKDSGCNDEFITKFIISEKKINPKERLKLLFSHRKTLLEGLHIKQKQIDCLD